MNSILTYIRLCFFTLNKKTNALYSYKCTCSLRWFYISIFVISLMFSQKIYAQQDFINGYYMFNPLAFNPAIVGVNDQFVASGIAREQWTGLNGAPSTQYLNIHAPIYTLFDRFDRVANRDYPTGLSAGLSLVHDKIGASRFTRFSMPLGYRVRLNEAGVRLSVGIRTDVSTLAFDLLDLRNNDTGDNLVKASDPKTYIDFSVGGYVYHQNWYLGISATNVREKDLIEDFGYQSVRHWFGSAGFALPVSDQLVFRTTTLATLVKGAPFTFTVSPAIIISDNVETGVSYRYDDMFGAFLSIKPLRNLRVGYWYEYPIGIKTGEIGSTHEIMFQYTFNKYKKQVVSPRYFW